MHRDSRGHFYDLGEDAIIIILKMHDVFAEFDIRDSPGF